MTDITEVKKLIALSPEGARLLGADVYRQRTQCRIDSAAQVALPDGTTVISFRLFPEGGPQAGRAGKSRSVAVGRGVNMADLTAAKKTLNLRVAAGTKKALSRIAGELGVVAVQGRYAGEPSISQLVDMIAAGKLVVVRRDNEGDNVQQGS